MLGTVLIKTNRARKSRMNLRNFFSPNIVCVAMTPKEVLARGMMDLEELHKRGKVTIQFGELIISSDFDSGTVLTEHAEGGREGGREGGGWW